MIECTIPFCNNSMKEEYTEKENYENNSEKLKTNKMDEQYIGCDTTPFVKGNVVVRHPVNNKYKNCPLKILLKNLYLK